MTAIKELLEPTLGEHAVGVVEKLVAEGIEEVCDFALIDDKDLRREKITDYAASTRWTSLSSRSTLKCQVFSER